MQKACAEAVASEGYKSASDKLNATARYPPEAEFKALFEADSVRNAEAVKKAGISSSIRDATSGSLDPSP